MWPATGNGRDGSTGELERNLAGALIFIIDPDNNHSVSTRRLALVHGLSETEAEVCRLMGGRGIGS
jgi:hypothetical protein